MLKRTEHIRRGWPAAMVLLCVASAAWADYPTDVLSMGPVAYWRLGESSGTIAADASGNSLHGDYSGVTLGQPGALFGDADTAAAFDGAASFVQIDHDSAMLLDSGTVLLWFMDTDGVQTAGLFSKDSAGYGTGGHLNVMINTGRLVARLQSTDNYYEVTSGFISADRWYMAALTFGATGMKLYMDGALADTDGYTGGLGTTSGGAGNYEPLALGANTWSSGDLTIQPLVHHFSGRMDEVAIFDGALSVDDIAQLYETGTTPEPGALALLALGGLALIRRKRK